MSSIKYQRMFLFQFSQFSVAGYVFLREVIYSVQWSERVSVLWKSCWLVRILENFIFQDKRVRSGRAGKVSVGQLLTARSVFDAVLVRLQVNLGSKRNMYVTMRKTFSYEQYFCITKLDAMLPIFAVNTVASCYSGSDGNWSDLNLLVLFFAKRPLVVEEASRLSWESLGLSTNGSLREYALKTQVCQHRQDFQMSERSSIRRLSSNPKFLSLTLLQTLVIGR